MGRSDDGARHGDDLDRAPAVARRRVPRRSIQPRLLTQAPRSYRGDLPPPTPLAVRGNLGVERLGNGFESAAREHHGLGEARAEHNLVIEAIVAGACGYILKSSPVAAIIAAVVATARGEVVISSTIAERLLTRIRERDSGVTAGGEDAARAIVAALTPRELEIFTRLAGGASNRDIGRELSLSRSTAADHLASILDKLHLENRVQAAVQAVRCGLA